MYNNNKQKKLDIIRKKQRQIKITMQYFSELDLMINHKRQILLRKKQ